jgi:hypothetical protein
MALTTHMSRIRKHSAKIADNSLTGTLELGCGDWPQLTLSFDLTCQKDMTAAAEIVESLQAMLMQYELIKLIRTKGVKI